MDDIAYEVFVKSLMYQSEYLLSIKGLPSGYSKDVSGDVSLTLCLIGMLTISNR
jgi:hypothetical protein